MKMNRMSDADLGAEQYDLHISHGVLTDDRQTGWANVFQKAFPDPYPVSDFKEV